MNFTEQIITIAIVALATMTTRFLPFFVFRARGIGRGRFSHVGRALPPMVFAMLVVYCFRGISFAAPEGYLPHLIATAAVVILHLIFRKTLLSVALGTGVYILLVNLIFI